MNTNPSKRFTLFATFALLFPLGCAGPGPKLFPITPVDSKELPGGGWRHEYDTNVDGRPDSYEWLSAEGMITAIGCDADPAHAIDLSAIPPAEQRHLVLLLDSIPYEIADEVWREGRFRYFHRPSRIIAPFPVMTDLSFCEFFGCSPAPGIESSYYTGEKLTTGYDVYTQEGNVIWQRNIDYRLNPLAHAPAYLDPFPWFDRELRSIAELFLNSSGPLTIGYAVGTSAVGASGGRTGHQIALVRLDRFCQWLMFKTQGRARITLLSDHGHAFYDSKRVPLRDIMADMGYHVSKSLRKPNDVVIPEFGMVSCAAIHTCSPARVARDAIGIEGVELAAYVEHDEIVVLSRSGKARISAKSRGLQPARSIITGRTIDSTEYPKPTAFRYEPEFGDPLELNSTIEQLTKSGRQDADGFIDDGVLFEVTTSATYPDVIARLWRAFHGLVEHPPDVLLSLQDGYHAGSPTMTSLFDLIGVHGSLRPQSTYGMAMTMTGELPRTLRMSELKGALEQHGVPFKSASTTSQAGN